MKYVFATSVLFAVSERAHDLIFALIAGTIGIALLRLSARKRR